MVGKEQEEIKEEFIKLTRKVEINNNGYDIKFIHDIYKLFQDKLKGCRKQEVYYRLKEEAPLILDKWRSINKYSKKKLPIRLEFDDRKFIIYAIRRGL